jgi:AAA+ ATPase superfamily predicted ATPase
MLFDTAPKTNKRDLYDRETELEKFKDAIEYSSLIVIQGLRRTGKTSFIT